jgi:hypothetical protein
LPTSSAWLTTEAPRLVVCLDPALRSALTSWLRLLGETNGLVGLGSGSLDRRLRQARRILGDLDIVIWTTPTRWAAGDDLTLRFPRLGLDLGCSLEHGQLTARSLALASSSAPDPRREPGSVGVVLRVPDIDVPVNRDERSNAAIQLLTDHFQRLGRDRWSGFSALLREAVEADSQADLARQSRLTSGFREVRRARQHVWTLSGVNAEVAASLEVGERLELLDDRQRPVGSGRLVDIRTEEGALDVDLGASADPTVSGAVRPRSRSRIIEQKRALLDQLESPTGDLPGMVALVAAPDVATLPRPQAVARFANPAVAAAPAQAHAVALALGLEDGQALVIQGPPGTGKSTTAAEIISQVIERDPAIRVLVCSHSNHGADNLLARLRPFIPNGERRIARVGVAARVAAESRPYYTTDRDLGGRSVVFTTIDSLALRDAAGAQLYEYVLLDEANRAGVLDSLLALARGRRMILIGDAMQLQPVVSEAERRVASGSNGHPHGDGLVERSLMSWLLDRGFPAAATVLLDQQNRMHPAIGELVSSVFYGGRVTAGPAAPRKALDLDALPDPVTWIDTRALAGNCEVRRGTSFANQREAALVAEIVRYLAATLPIELSIGVIAMYAEQRELLRRLLGRERRPGDRAIEVETVDAFEGREQDVVVVSLVRANQRASAGFLAVEERLNVAVSRARRLLILVGDTSTLRKGRLGDLVDAVRAVGRVVDAGNVVPLGRADAGAAPV